MPDDRMMNMDGIQGPNTDQRGDNEANGEMTVREAGRKGGETVKRKYGPEFYEEIGKEGGRKRAEELGHEGYVELGKKGGETVRELIEKGKQSRGGNQQQSEESDQM